MPGGDSHRQNLRLAAVGKAVQQRTPPTSSTSPMMSVSNRTRTGGGAAVKMTAHANPSHFHIPDQRFCAVILASSFEISGLPG